MKNSIVVPGLAGWRSANALWIELAEQHPDLGIAPTTPAWYGFIRHHREALVDAGVLIRLTSRSWLADPARFAAAVTAIKCGAPITALRYGTAARLRRLSKQ